MIIIKFRSGHAIILSRFFLSTALKTNHSEIIIHIGSHRKMPWVLTKSQMTVDKLAAVAVYALPNETPQ